jgi:hypothetical protein
MLIGILLTQSYCVEIKDQRFPGSGEMWKGRGEIIKGNQMNAYEGIVLHLDLVVDM